MRDNALAFSSYKPKTKAHGGYLLAQSRAAYARVLAYGAPKLTPIDVLPIDRPKLFQADSPLMCLILTHGSVLRDLCRDYPELRSFLEACRLAINDESQQGGHAGFTILATCLARACLQIFTGDREQTRAGTGGDLLRESLLQRLANKGIGFLDGPPPKLPSEMLASFASALADESSFPLIGTSGPDPFPLLSALTTQVLPPSCHPKTVRAAEGHVPTAGVLLHLILPHSLRCPADAYLTQVAMHYPHLHRPDGAGVAYGHYEEPPRQIRDSRLPIDMQGRTHPPKRVKSSPIREVIKSGKKIPKDASPGLEHEKKGNQGSKGKQGGLPLRRAGLDTSRKLNFFAKPNGIPKLPGTGLACKEKEEGDTLMIDVESIIVADEIRKQAIAVEQVRDASGKWLTDYPMRKRNEIEQLAVRFLLTMNSTLCFFTVAMRMLSKAPWTESMASVDVRQFALVAISRGWYVKQLASTKHSFTRAELALAAGVYEGLITPTLPDDTTVALRTIIDHLPEACNSMFSKAEVTCPFCHARSNSVVTTFSSCISWKDQTWTNLKQALAQAQPFVGHLPRNWHAEGCNRDDQDPKITKLGKWLYLELRPYPVLKNAFFPFLSESSALILDDSLVTEGLYVDCLVCSNLCAGESRHYWLVEINEGKVQQIYDSLQGVQPLTQEIYRMLQVTGILLKSTSSNKPVLKCPQLEQKAGIIEAVSRRAPTIKVASRSRTCKTRHELAKA